MQRIDVACAAYELDAAALAAYVMSAIKARDPYSSLLLSCDAGNGRAATFRAARNSFLASRSTG
jgi:hypothetical protein